MGRRSKAKNFEIDYGVVFSDDQQNGPMSDVWTVETAHHCRECGRKPRLHDMNFRDKDSYPNHIYIDCECGCCDGEWYNSVDDALEGWNEMNPSESSPVMPYGFEDSVDALKIIMK